MFDENLSWMRDTGLIQKMEADAVRDSKAKNEKFTKTAGDRPMTIWKYDESTVLLSDVRYLTYEKNSCSLSPGFAIWSVGVLLSVMVFIYEKESDGPGKPKIHGPKTKKKKKVGFTKNKPIGLTTVDD